MSLRKTRGVGQGSDWQNRWYQENREHQDRFLEQLEIWKARARKEMWEDGAAQEGYLGRGAFVRRA